MRRNPPDRLNCLIRLTAHVIYRIFSTLAYLQPRDLRSHSLACPVFYSSSLSEPSTASSSPLLSGKSSSMEGTVALSQTLYIDTTVLGARLTGFRRFRPPSGGELVQLPCKHFLTGCCCGGSHRLVFLRFLRVLTLRTLSLPVACVFVVP